MKLLPITLSVKRKAFRADTPLPPASDQVYRKARLQALERDKHTCRFCGFHSERNETHHINDDHSDHSIDNLVTACVLCHMCHHIAYAGQNGRATLIYLADKPDGSQHITQAGLNNLVRTLWIAEILGSQDMKSTAAQLLARLKAAEMYAVQTIGTSSPLVIGDFMSEQSDEQYQQRGNALSGIYLLPEKQAYSPHIKLWVEKSKSFGPGEWVKKAVEKIAQWDEAS